MDGIFVGYKIHCGGYYSGDMLVVDSQGSDRAVSGSLFPTEAIRKGLAGIVVDGPCRDTRTIRELDLPYYARSHTLPPCRKSEVEKSEFRSRKS